MAGGRIVGDRGTRRGEEGASGDESGEGEWDGGIRTGLDGQVGCSRDRWPPPMAAGGRAPRGAHEQEEQGSGCMLAQSVGAVWVRA
jgi:hypothetical protein